MKKNGFTLAEVLITLAIIGVVATMTLPALMNNTQEQQARTGLKKGFNTLIQAASMNQAADNFDYGTLQNIGTVTQAIFDENGDFIDGQRQSLWQILEARTNVDFTLTNAGDAIPCGGADGDFPQTVYLRDGSAILLPAGGQAPDAVAQNYGAQRDDGLNGGFVVVYDTNGAKAPNQLSNCRGESAGAYDTGIDAGASSDGAGAGDAAIEEGQDPSNCRARGMRVIRDQFTVFLRGATVQPAGAAAAWAFEN